MRPNESQANGRNSGQCSLIDAMSPAVVPTRSHAVAHATYSNITRTVAGSTDGAAVRPGSRIRVLIARRSIVIAGASSRRPLDSFVPKARPGWTVRAPSRCRRRSRGRHVCLVSAPTSAPVKVTSVVEEHDVLRDGVAPDAQFVGRKVRVGVADGQRADDRELGRDLQLGADDVGIPRHRDLHARAQPRSVRASISVCKYMPTVTASAGPRSRCMQTMPASGAPKNSKLRITAAAGLAVSALVIPIEPYTCAPSSKR